MKRQGWTKGACPVAEELAMERTAILDHWWLGTGGDGVAFICRVLERLEALAGTIPARSRARSQTALPETGLHQP